MSSIKHLVKMFHYIDLPGEQNYKVPVKPHGWPKNPSISLNSLSVRRDEFSPLPILRNISLSIPAMEKVGIFGRGTSGIYSLFPSIMRRVQPILNEDHARGTIKIDGVDINHLGRKCNPLPI